VKLTTKGHATRARIVAGAAAHVREHGVEATTLDAVMARTGTSKGQLFHYFPGGKDELFLEVARHEAARVLADQEPHLQQLDSWESWYAWRDAVVERYRAQGPNCPLSAVTAQVRNTPGAAEVAKVLLAQWQCHIGRGVRVMQQRGQVDAAVDADRMAAAFIAGIQGGVTVLMSTGDIGHLETILDLLIGHLGGVRDGQPVVRP